MKKLITYTIVLGCTCAVSFFFAKRNTPSAEDLFTIEEVESLTGCEVSTTTGVSIAACEGTSGDCNFSYHGYYTFNGMKVRIDADLICDGKKAVGF